MIAQFVKAAKQLDDPRLRRVGERFAGRALRETEVVALERIPRCLHGRCEF